MLSTIFDFIKTEPKFVISAATAVISFIVNIIIAIKNNDACKLKEAILKVPEIVCMVEDLSTFKETTAIEKKAMAEAILLNRFGKIYRKNSKLFDDAIEDILSTPQKKGGSDDVSKENEKIQG